MIIHHFGTSFSTHKSPFNGGYEVMANLYEAINVLLTTVLCLYGTRPLVAISHNANIMLMLLLLLSSRVAKRERVFTQRRGKAKALIRLADGMDVVLMLVSHFDSCFTIRRLDLWPVSYPPKTTFKTCCYTLFKTLGIFGETNYGPK